ncbi:histidine phosphatase family protein [Paraburkholderia sp. EG304]|uniref:histidine phosphatase family protein n=1 Tax=Paraburkholderia sp. EG304 TaxID=3237015 RepID=UPI00397DC3B4
MAELYLVRHGQASFGASDYDVLSEVGERQGVWLGEYFAQLDLNFDRVMTGGMRRHRQTLDAICRGMGRSFGPVEQHAGLDEYNFQALFDGLDDSHQDLKAWRGASRQEFYRSLKRVLQLWSKDLIRGPIPETWREFQHRVEAARRAIQRSPAERVLVVTSGGVMAAIAQQALQAPADAAIALNLQIRNSSFCRFFFNRDAFHLASFNSDPHLDRADRRRFQTFG